MDGIIPQLHEAARNNDSAKTKDLLRRFEYAPQMAIIANGLTPAHVAALSGSLDVLKALVEFSQEDRKFVATAQDKQGLTVLHYAALGGDPDIVGFLLTEFGESATMRNYNGGLPIHFAAGAGHLEVLRKLVTHSGAHLANDKDNTGTSPAYFAAQEGHLECFKYLCIEAYADKLSRAGDGMTTLHGATQGGHFETIKWIVQQMGPKIIQDRSDDGATPVHFAAASGHEDILAYFLQQGNTEVLISCVDNEGATPAHDAVEYGYLKSLKILVQYSADLTIEDDEGESPFSLAMKAPSDDPIYIFVKEFMRLAPSPLRGRHTRADSEGASIVSLSDTSGHPKTSRQEATEIQRAADQANQILSHRTKHVKEQQRLAKERQHARRKESLQAAKNRLLAFDPIPQRNVKSNGHSRIRSRSQDNIFETSPGGMARRKHQSTVSRLGPSAGHRRPYGYIDTEDLLLDKFVTHGFGMPAPALKNLKHAKRVDLSQVSELVKRRESIRTRKDVYLYRQKQLRRIMEQSVSKKKILKYEDIKKKLDTTTHVTDTFEPPAPPITLEETPGANKWDQYIETDSDPDSVDERYNIAAGIEYTTLLLLAPSCCSAFTSSLPDETFIATEGKRGYHGEKGIKLGKMKNRNRQVAGAGEDLSDQSDDPFAYDDIEARRKGWDETTTGVSKPTKKSKHFIGGEDVRQPGDIITAKEKGKNRKMSVTKGLSSLRKKVSKYKQTKDYSDSNSSIVSYASDGEGVPDGDDEQSLVAETFDSPLFTPSARLESGEVTPKPDTVTQFKYTLPEMADRVIRPKVTIKDEMEVFTPPPPLSETEIEPIISGYQSPKSVVKEEKIQHSSYSGVTRTTDNRRKNVKVPVKTTPAVKTISNVLEIPSGSSDSCSSVESEPIKTPVKSDIGQVTPSKPIQITPNKPGKLIGQVTPAKSNKIALSKPGKLIGLESSVMPLKSTAKDSSLSKSNEELNAILRELDLIGLDLQMEIDGFSDVTTPPTQVKGPKVNKPETKVNKPELKVNKPEPKVNKKEVISIKPRTKSETNVIKSETNVIKSETNVIKSETNVIKSETKIETSPKFVGIKQLQKENFSQAQPDKKGDKVAQVEPKMRTRGGRSPGGLKLSYNAENNYPESMDSSSMVSTTSKISKQGSDLFSQIEQHEKLVSQVSTANQIHLDKQTELKKKLSSADDAVRKYSLSYEQAQTHLRKVSVSPKQPQVVEEARKRANDTLALLEKSKNDQTKIKEQLEAEVQQLSQLQDTLAQMMKFKSKQDNLLDQISKETEVAQVRRKPPVVPESPKKVLEERVISTQKDLQSSSDDDEFIPPAETWKLISSQTTATIQRLSNTDIQENAVFTTATKNLSADLRSGQMTPRTLELIEATRGHISISSLKRKGVNQTEVAQHDLDHIIKEPTGVKRRVFRPKEEFCVVCQLRVYPTEKYLADGKILHLTCIKCSVCKRRLTTGQVAVSNHLLFCNAHLPS